MIVDSCVDSRGTPRPLCYLEDLGIDPAESVRSVVATHWHDDHIKGMAQVVARCRKARFCCSGALGSREFLAAVGRSEVRSRSRVSSGVRELHEVFSHLAESRRPTWALADRLLDRFSDSDVWALSPDDTAFDRFLESLTRLLPDHGATKRRIPRLSPNEASVVLWVRSPGFTSLLGADLERAGWQRIVGRKTRPEGMASAFKVAHHGAESAHEPAVWKRMLMHSPVAILTPWKKGGGSLPTKADQRRIAEQTTRAYVTAPPSGTRKRKEQSRAVERTLREMGAELRRDSQQFGAVRLRRRLDDGGKWSVETLGVATRLGEEAV